jgi:hypothetical protein
MAGGSHRVTETVCLLREDGAVPLAGHDADEPEIVSLMALR